jgi:hypothetical protein
MAHRSGQVLEPPKVLYVLYRLFFAGMLSSQQRVSNAPCSAGGEEEPYDTPVTLTISLKVCKLDS